MSSVQHELDTLFIVASIPSSVKESCIQRGDNSDTVSEIISKMQRANQWVLEPTGEDDHSALDMALVGRLVYWCSGDEVMIDKIFKASPLYRKKWDEKHNTDGRTYGEMTIAKAISNSSNNIHPYDYMSAKNGDFEPQLKIKIESKEQLIDCLLSMSKAPEPAVQADTNGIAFYGNISMIYGEAKQGKSFIAAEALKDSDAIFIDIDSNGLELHEHLILNNITPLHGAQAEPFLQMVLNYKGDENFIIVIDSFANYADELGFNINDTRDVTKLFKSLRCITDKGHALVLIHHMTTNTGVSKMQGNQGAILGRVDITYILEAKGVLVLDRSRVSNALQIFKGCNATWLYDGVVSNVEVP